MVEENKTRGHGAGGANTNKNGLPYEELTDLNSEFIVFCGYSITEVPGWRGCVPLQKLI